MMKQMTNIPSKQARLEEIILAGMAEIMPLDRLNDLLRLNNTRIEKPSLHLATIPGFLIENMSFASAAGLLIRAGRSSFKYLFDAWGIELGFTSIEYRLSPQPRRIRSGLEKLSGLFTNNFGYPSDFIEDSTQFTWRFHTCPFCIPASNQQPVCFLATGLLQEFFGWASGGKYFPASEKKCLAHNNNCCEIYLDKKPLD